MYFRAFAVDLDSQRYIQIQLIGTADGPVKPENRKYDLLKAVLSDGELERRGAHCHAARVRRYLRRSQSSA